MVRLCLVEICSIDDVQLKNRVFADPSILVQKPWLSSVRFFKFCKYLVSLVVMLENFF